MERLPGPGRSLGSGSRQALLGRYSAVCAHFPGGDTEFSVAKDVVGKNVCDAEDQHQDTAGDDDPPEGCAQGCLGCSLLI